jgi:hypothetical protein
MDKLRKNVSRNSTLQLCIPVYVSMEYIPNRQMTNVGILRESASSFIQEFRTDELRADLCRWNEYFQV